MSNRTQFIIGTAGLVLLFGAYFGALALAGWYDKKEREKRGEPPLFDERQRLARLRAGNHALYTLVGLLIVWVILDGIGQLAWTGEILDMVLSVLLAAWGVWAVDCIWNDGYISWKHKGMMSNTYALTVLTIMLNVTNTFRSSGIIKSAFPFIVCLTDMLVLIAVIVYKWRKEKQMKREEDAL